MWLYHNYLSILLLIAKYENHPVFYYKKMLLWIIFYTVSKAQVQKYTGILEEQILIFHSWDVYTENTDPLENLIHVRYSWHFRAV